MIPRLTRRLGLIGGAGLLLSGCDRITGSRGFQQAASHVEQWTKLSQRFLLAGGQLAHEYPATDIAPVFRANGTTNPNTSAYNDHAARDFVDWRLRINGLVKRPLELSMADLRRLPSRTQITRHDCVEGWSCIGQWTGAPLGLLLTSAGLLPGARFAMFHCADNLDGNSAKGGEQSPGQYYESIDLVDAFHPQTLLAYDLNGKALDIAHGAPIRLRVERQLGYKHAKYVQHIQIVSSFAPIAGGKGGYWEDRGYDWYAGI